MSPNTLGLLMSISSAYHRTFLAILVGIITVAFLVVMRSFLVTMMLAAIFTVMVYPGYRLVLSWCHGRSRVAAAIYMIAIALIVIIPSIVFLGVLIAQGVQISTGATTFIQQHVKQGDLTEQLQKVPYLDRVLPHRDQILAKTTELTSAVASFVVARLKDFTKSTLNVVVHTVLMFYAMYFFLMDGPHLLKTITEYLPLSKSEREQLIQRFTAVSIVTIKSTVVIGFVQGAMGGAGFAVAGIPGAAFWGAIMVVLAMIPGIGTALVWVPAAGYLLLLGRYTACIIFTLYFVLAVGLIDNFLRPRLVGKGTQMHELLVLLSTLGGLMAFGLVGFIIGPVIASLFITLWVIQGTPVRSSSDADDD
jgi:predicted PurR-regulated permease PerM